MKDKSAQPE